MKKFTIRLLFLSGILFSVHSQAQWMNVLSENCDAAVAPALPSGFTSNPADTTGWVTDASGTNASTGYSNDLAITASGLSNIVVTNNTSVAGLKYLVLPTFATTNFDSVSFSWGARLTKHFLDNGSTIGLTYSTDGGSNWTSLPYTENTNDSNWYLDNAGKPVYLPYDALNKANIMIRFEANIVPNPSGTYRVDDLQINAHKKSLGTLSPSVWNAETKSFYDASDRTLTVTLVPGENYNLTISNILGQFVTGKKNVGNKVSLDLSQVTDGVYFLSVYNLSSGKMITSRFNKN